MNAFRSELNQISGKPGKLLQSSKQGSSEIGRRRRPPIPAGRWFSLWDPDWNDTENGVIPIGDQSPNDDEDNRENCRRRWWRGADDDYAGRNNNDHDYAYHLNNDDNDDNDIDGGDVMVVMMIMVMMIMDDDNGDNGVYDDEIDNDRFK